MMNNDPADHKREISDDKTILRTQISYQFFFEWDIDDVILQGN